MCIRSYIIVNCKSKGFRIWVVDVKLAYRQSEKPLVRKIFITNPVLEFGLPPQECLELLKPIYGIADSGYQWHQTLDDHIQIDLEMKTMIIDSSLHCKFENDQIKGTNGSYVDDLLRTGTYE